MGGVGKIRKKRTGTVRSGRFCCFRLLLLFLLLLAAAGLQAKEIRVKTDRNAQGSIVMTEVAVRFVYPSEAERARALLSGVLGDEVRITVETGEEETSAA